MMPTANQAKRIQSAIDETTRLIIKEEKYSKDLQKLDYLKSLYAHLDKLHIMLATGEGLPVL